jgi:hypothetical protein
VIAQAERAADPTAATRGTFATFPPEQRWEYMGQVPDSATRTAPRERGLPRKGSSLHDDEYEWERARAIELGWSEAPFASLIAVPGTSCRCTVSRQALSALAAIDELGPDDAYRVFTQRREDIEAIARWKVKMLGPPRNNVVAICIEDVRDHMLADDAEP